MSLDISITSLQDLKQLGQLTDFMHKQDLGYPGYHDWVERAKQEILSGYKKAFLAYDSGRLAGNVVFQTHKGASSMLEIKNLRIHPDVRKTGFARFLLNQVERYALGKYSCLIGDVRSDKPDLVAFMCNSGFKPVYTIPLHEDEKPDVVLVKLLQPSDSRKIIN